MQHRNWKVNKSRNYVQYLDDETQGLKKKKSTTPPKTHHPK